jgi:hypothetical protein
VIFRIRYENKGVHIHCTLFAGAAGTTLANCGKLIMSQAEFEAFREQATFIDFKEAQR